MLVINIQINFNKFTLNLLYKSIIQIYYTNLLYKSIIQIHPAHVWYDEKILKGDTVPGKREREFDLVSFPKYVYRDI